MRSYLRDHRYELAVSAGREYPRTVENTPLLAPAEWLPAEPIPLRDLDLHFDPNASFDGIRGTEPVATSTLPIRPDGSIYDRYSDVVADLAAPKVFENRTTYRLVNADFASSQRLEFGTGCYFDSIDIGDAAAHEYTASILGEFGARPLRSAIGDPWDPTIRPVNLAISALTIRLHRPTGTATVPLHSRGMGSVGHAGGMYHVLPVGIFQPASDHPGDIANDFSLWRCMIREYAEEFLGQPERYGTEGSPLDYENWPIAAHLTSALESGYVRAYCLGLGVDPLTFATDVLAAVVIDAPAYDELFGGMVTVNPEGEVEPSIPFTTETVERFAQHEPTQAAGAALLRLSWRHRRYLLV